MSELEARTKAFLQAGQRERRAKLHLQMQRVQKDLAENEGQLKMHEDAYNNNLTKVKHASGKLAQVREKIQKYDAELKMSRAEAEMAKLAQDFNFDVTTDFGQIEQVIQDKIGLNRAKARVAADLSGAGGRSRSSRSRPRRRRRRKWPCNSSRRRWAWSRPKPPRPPRRPRNSAPPRRRSSRIDDTPDERRYAP